MAGRKTTKQAVAEQPAVYVAVQYFEDLEDGGRPYKVGEVYPREGFKPAQKRIDELLSNKNKQGRAVIAKK